MFSLYQTKPSQPTVSDLWRIAILEDSSLGYVRAQTRNPHGGNVCNDFVNHRLQWPPPHLRLLYHLNVCQVSEQP